MKKKCIKTHNLYHCIMWSKLHMHNLFWRVLQFDKYYGHDYRMLISGSVSRISWNCWQQHVWWKNQWNLHVIWWQTWGQEQPSLVGRGTSKWKTESFVNYQTCCLLTKGEKCLETRQTKSKIKDIFLNYNLGGYTTILLLLNMKQF